MRFLNTVGKRLLAVCLLCSAMSAFAFPREVVRTDLAPLIDEAAKSREQFAVNIPHHLTTAAQGVWSAAPGVAIWRYSIEIPTAVSISFHAAKAALPANAVLSVRAGSATYIYRPKDLHNGELWSRIAKGDALDFTLRVPANARSQVKFEIDSFQAGYRALGGSLANHPHYDKIMRAVTGANNASCVENFACAATASNKAAGQATVGLIIEDLYQCTGTLLEDVPGDNTPYVLTARHCQTGQFGGGNPGAAIATTVYWDAMSPCSLALGTLYDPGVLTQTGASTVVEQQDAWLIRLDESPAVSDAYFAGFDATGAAVEGGYTIQHALGYDKQLTDWFGQADPLTSPGVLGVGYLSNFLEVVNEAGNIGPGASGSALYDQNNRLVGSLSLGRASDDASGYESCPMPAPPQPDGTNGAADFTSLAAVWNSTTDSTSTTGSATLKSVLDPAQTGSLSVDSAAAVYISFAASATSVAVGGNVELAWNASGASACTATGGVTGDGWTGSLDNQSAKQVSESADAVVTYYLTCQFSGGRHANAAASVTWGAPILQVSFNSSFAVWPTRPAKLVWASNVSPCSISGGSVALSNLPSSGFTTTTQPTTGDVTYTIICGIGDDSVTTATSVQYVTPAVQFSANGTDRRLGEPLILQWQSYADSCAPTGGAPNDGWNATQFADPGDGATFSANVTTLGTYTYSLTCLSGSISVQKQLVIKVEDDAPFVNASVDRTSLVFTGSLSDSIHISWNSNLSLCIPSSTPLGSLDFTADSLPQDTGSALPPSSGVFAISIMCTGMNDAAAATSTPITVTVLPPMLPSASVVISPKSVVTGETFTMTWNSTNTANCIGSTNSPDVPWNLQLSSGTQTAESQIPGTYTFNITCASIDPTQAAAQAHANLVVSAAPAPTVTVTMNPTSITKGQAFKLSWSSTNATVCSGSGGGADGVEDFGGQLQATTASETLTAMDVGMFTYTVTCTSKAGSAHSSASISVSAAVTGGTDGGGGAMHWLDLLALAAFAILRVRRPEYARGEISGYDCPLHAGRSQAGVHRAMSHEPDALGRVLEKRARSVFAQDCA